MLSNAQLDRFRESGFIIVERVLPLDLVDRLREEALAAPYEGTESWREFNPSITLLSEAQCAAVRLIQPMVDDLIARDGRLRGLQFALNARSQWAEPYFHVDGAGSLLAGSRLTDLPGYMLGCGVTLVDLTSESRGNLLVKPGGHYHVQEFFRGADDAEFEQCALCGGVNYWIENERHYISAELPPVTILARPGDIYLFHGMLPHAIGHNTHADRPAIYLRFGTYESPGLHALRNMWDGWSLDGGRRA
jgi:ectoine hydroxylase-related dioxygenase (phytanoyl-CoA dioxygenase family)